MIILYIEDKLFYFSKKMVIKIKINKNENK